MTLKAFPPLVAAAALVAGLVAVGTSGRRASAASGSVAPPRSAPTSGDPRARIFLERGCAECHAIAGLGVNARTDVGPDLTFAYRDVVNRYEVSLESFLDDPPGVMRLMLASHLHLTAADRDSMLDILKAVFDERRAEMDDEIPSFPPVSPRSRRWQARTQEAPSQR